METSAASRCESACRCTTTWRMAARTLSTPAPVRAEAPRTCTLPSPSRARIPLSDSSTGCTSRFGQPVDLVQHHQRDGAVRGQRRQEVVVHGGVGVLLRIQHPDEDVHQAHHALHDLAVGGPGRVEVRQVQQDQAAWPRRRSPAPAPAWCRLPHVQPVQQRLRCRPLPRHRQRFRRGGPAGCRRRDFSPADRIEQGGLAAAGGTEEAHHGVVGGQGPPRAGPLQDLEDVLQGVVRKDAVCQFTGVVQGLEPALQPGRFPGQRRGGSRGVRQPAQARRHGRPARPADAPGSSVQPVQEALLFSLQQPLAAGVQVFAGGPGEPADGVLAEDRLEQPLADDGGAAGDADSPVRSVRRSWKRPRSSGRRRGR